MNPTIKRIIIGLLILGAMAVAGWIIAAITADAADLPEYADLTFTDQTDLDARVDSVLAVCDTVRHRRYTAAEIDSLWEEFGMDVYDPLILACRRFAGLTVFNMPGDLRYDTPIDVVNQDLPGNARIYWWEKEE